jgi:hypothetical protein
MGRVFRHMLTATALLGVVAGEGNTPSNAQNPSKNNNAAYAGTAIGGVVSGWTSAVANFLRARRDPSVNAVSGFQYWFRYCCALRMLCAL